MVGIGKWTGKVNTMFFKGDVNFELKDNNGEYEFDFELPDMLKGMEVKYNSVEVNGNTIVGKGEVSKFPGKELIASATFDGDTMTGYLKLPVLGGMKVNITDGHRVTD